MRKNPDLNIVIKFTNLLLKRIQNLHASDVDDSETLVKDFLQLSESSLNKVWIEPEEDEAWKDL